jgi:uncharacterized membrane protein
VAETAPLQQSAETATAPGAAPAAPEAAPAEPVAIGAAAADVTREAAVAAPRRDLLAPIKRWLFGGNTIVKAGVGILFVGLAFLAKYASEHAHLPVEVRLAGIGAAAVILLGIG